MWARLGSLVSLGRVQSATGAAAKTARVRATVAGVADDVPWIQPYGYQSRPTGGQAVVLAVGGSGDEAVAILVGDRRYLLALEAGEVCMSDDLGQRVHLTRTGIVIDSDSIALGDGATAGVARVGDGAGITGPWLSWLIAVAGAAGYVVAPPTGDPLTSLSEGSTKVTAS